MILAEGLMDLAAEAAGEAVQAVTGDNPCNRFRNLCNHLKKGGLEDEKGRHNFDSIGASFYFIWGMAVWLLQ